MLAETNSPKDMVNRSASFMINLPTTAPYMTCLTIVHLAVGSVEVSVLARLLPLEHFPKPLVMLDSDIHPHIS